LRSASPPTASRELVRLKCDHAVVSEPNNKLEPRDEGRDLEVALSWHEVLALHGSRRGIRITGTHATLLLDFGLSRYVNRRVDGRITYEGEGKRGDQTPTRGNAGLLECHESGRALRVFERTRPGVWFDRGLHVVSGVEYVWREVEHRHVFEFLLEPQEKP
jgi:hypothetical protein